MTCLTFIISTHLGLNEWYKAVVDTTFCPCCALPSPLPGRSASPLLRIFRIPTCACLAYWNWMIPSAAWHYWWLNDPFCSGHITVHCQWEKKPKAAPSTCDFVTLPEEDWTTAIGNMHQKYGKRLLCGCGDMLTDRQTDRHAHTDMLITIIRSRSWSNNQAYKMVNSIVIPLYRLLIILQRDAAMLARSWGVVILSVCLSVTHVFCD